jgi:tetratricopeptide (TPR) repeat protein
LRAHGGIAEKDRIEEVIRRLSEFTDSAESQLVAALLYEARGADDAALKAACAAARINPDYFYHQAVLSRFAAHAKRAEEARVARTRALALAPEGLDPNTLELLFTQASPRSSPTASPHR